MASTSPVAVHPARASDQAVSWPDLGLNTLETAIVQTLAYADVFDYPLTPEEVHRYLVRVPASLAAVHDALRVSVPMRRYLTCYQDYVILRGREKILETRRRRASVATSMWPRVEHYASFIAHLPFVRMVGVSGALSVGNAEGGTDIDYFIVTEPGRLWLCRATIIAVVRLAARAGDSLCPNYLVSEQALMLQERNLYTAHEFLQMVPLVGRKTYQQMWQLNAWTAEYLPNAYERARNLPGHLLPAHAVPSLMEAPLRTPVGAWLERWEMARKIDKFSRSGDSSNSAAFSSDWCKGHFLDHGSRTLAAFTARLQELAQI